jgi:hypothetical protein
VLFYDEVGIILYKSVAILERTEMESAPGEEGC